MSFTSVRSNFAGQIAITLNTEWHEPKDSTNPSDLEASETIMQVMMILEG